MGHKDFLSKLRILNLSALRRAIRRREVQERFGGWTITITLLCIMYFLAAWSDVSTTEYATRVLTFTSVAMPPAPPEPVVEISEPAPSDVEAPPVRERISLQPSPGLTSKPVSLSESRRPVNLDGQLSRLPPPSLSLSSPQGGAGVSPSGTQRRRRLSLPGASPELSGGGIGLPPARQLPTRVPDREVPIERKETETPEVRYFDDATLSETDSRTAAIIDWVKRNHSSLPIVVQTHLDYADGDYTAPAASTIGDRKVQLYLLVREGYDQLHVVMVDGENSYLFYDRGLRKTVSRFRVGQVFRNVDQITRIVSREREITSDEAQAFYSAFIEWWEDTEAEG